MASLRQAAQNVLDTARDGILWFAVWKDGRGWCSSEFYGIDYDERTSTAKIEDQEDLDELKEILSTDPNAIMVNSYYHNLGAFDGYPLTRDDLATFIRWQYELQSANLKDFLEKTVLVA